MYAYTHPGTSLEAFVDATDAVDAARRQQLLDQANQTDNDVVKKLAAVNAQLKNQQSELEHPGTRAGADQRPARRQAHRPAREPAGRRAGRRRPPDPPRRRDRRIAQFADAQHKAELEAEKAALAAQQTITSAGPGQVITQPGAGPFQCPVSGAAYSDDYGGPGGHPGSTCSCPPAPRQSR